MSPWNVVGWLVVAWGVLMFAWFVFVCVMAYRKRKLFYRHIRQVEQSLGPLDPGPRDPWERREWERKKKLRLP